MRFVVCSAFGRVIEHSYRAYMNILVYNKRDAQHSIPTQRQMYIMELVVEIDGEMYRVIKDRRGHDSDVQFHISSLPHFLRTATDYLIRKP